MYLGSPLRQIRYLQGQIGTTSFKKEVGGLYPKKFFSQGLDPKSPYYLMRQAEEQIYVMHA